jgi:hypothetical protein
MQTSNEPRLEMPVLPSVVTAPIAFIRLIIIILSLLACLMLWPIVFWVIVSYKALADWLLPAVASLGWLALGGSQVIGWKWVVEPMWQSCQQESSLGTVLVLNLGIVFHLASLLLIILVWPLG